MRLTDFGLEYKQWKEDQFPGVKEETKIFISHLLDENKAIKLWKHQIDSIIKIIYAYEIKEKNNLLLGIVTGGGKTAIIGGCIAWLKMSHNINKFLILVPNIIVKDRLERDFLPRINEKSVFEKFDYFPQEYKYLEQELSAHILESNQSPQGILDSGIVIGNIQQLYESNASGKRNLDWFINKTGNFAIFNDEAHNTPAQEYTRVLKILHPKIEFRLDTTATPDRADGRTPDSEMIEEYNISNALDDGIVKSVVVYQPDPKIIELTYTNKITGEKKKVTELDIEFKEAESNVKPFQWIMDKEPMTKQISIALRRFDEQKRRARDRYKPVLFIVTMSIEEGKRVKKVLEDEFNLGSNKVLLVTEDTAEQVVGIKSDGEPLTAREAATELGKVEYSYEVVISVLMLREGWDVPEVSVILLLRKFCSEVYGQQVIGRGLRKIRTGDERQILAVIDHPKLLHDWLWRKVGASGVRKVNEEDEFGDEDIPITPKIQQLVNPANLIDIPSPTYETKIDFDEILNSIPKSEVKKNWKEILNSVNYDKNKWKISKTRIEQIRKLYIDKSRKLEILPGEDSNLNLESEDLDLNFTKEELEDLLKSKIVSIVSELLFESGYAGLKKGILYNVVIEHVKNKLLNNKNLTDATQEELEIAIDCLEDVKQNFTKAIIDGIIGDYNGNK